MGGGEGGGGEVEAEALRQNQPSVDDAHWYSLTSQPCTRGHVRCKNTLIKHHISIGGGEGRGRDGREFYWLSRDRETEGTFF